MRWCRGALMLWAAAACAADGKMTLGAGQGKPPAIRQGVPECANLIGFVHIPTTSGTDMLTILYNTSVSLMLPSVEGARRIPGGRSQGRFPGWWHATALEQRQAVGQEVWSRAYTFAFVANPWARHVYLFLFNAGPARCGSRHWFVRRADQCTRWWLLRLDVLRASPNLTVTDFRQWVRSQKEAYPPGTGMAYRVSTSRRLGAEQYPSLRSAAQYPWLADKDGQLIVRDVFKREELEHHWVTLQTYVCGLRSISYANFASMRTSNCPWANKGLCVERYAGVRATRAFYRRYYDEEARGTIAEYMALDITNFNYTF
eukprot:TRINITY_DN2462_c0_g1_i1.p1 TRINITY_DN2462_c0_g1~~TRINITY_DN2462_c0_g1_i1.p1  ORF type:complete len:315 (+),score=48.43 TRINITY_DN2462_c0_g1_i1:93-1037(+)